MGTGSSSSYLGKHYLSCLENKKITTLKPVYLVFWKNKDYNSYSTKEDKAEIRFDKNYQSTCNYNNKCNLARCIKCESVFCIKINAKLTFYIQNIIGYDRLLDESGIIYYDIMPKFLNNTNKIQLSDIEFITVPIEYLNKIKQQSYLDISNVFFRDNFFNRCKFGKKDILDESEYNNKITNKEKLDFIAIKYKDDYLVEDI
jgi:hypothetical protein